MYYFPKRHFFNAPFPQNGPEYPAYPGEGAARSVISGSPVYFQPVNLKKAYISEFP